MRTADVNRAVNCYVRHRWDNKFYVISLHVKKFAGKKSRWKWQDVSFKTWLTVNLPVLCFIFRYILLKV